MAHTPHTDKDGRAQGHAPAIPPASNVLDWVIAAVFLVLAVGAVVLVREDRIALATGSFILAAIAVFFQVTRFLRRR